MRKEKSGKNSFSWESSTIASICVVLLVGAVTRCRCDITTAYSNTAGASQFGELLKPPPPPLSQILPVPFHGGAGRTQRQNVDVGYQYQAPPPPPPTASSIQVPQYSLSTDFKFPAPFYKQYNFNFVPPPQPFTTTPSPSLFHKVSTWLFPSQQNSYDAGSAFSSNSVKKDCNPCNLVPWIPVIRYNLGAKNVHQNLNPTYGPPSPTAQPQVAQFLPQPFQQHGNEQIKVPHLSPGVPIAVYGPPNQFNNAAGIISSTYGPPSPTHTVGFSSQSPIRSTFTASSSFSSIPSSTYGSPSTSIKLPSSSYLPSLSQGVVSDNSYNVPSSTYGPPTLLYSTPQQSYNAPLPVTTYGPPVTQYNPGSVNNGLQPNNDVEVLNNHGASSEQQLPKVSQPTEFRNSYGEIIQNTYTLDIPYPVSATAAESTKIKTEVLPNGIPKPERPNISMALANPAPFTLNKGRNIHTLQPVALPNLSVSPLPPIFNARPFRPIPSPLPSNVLQGINQMQQKPNNVDVAQSVPLVEFTHSIDYPATYVQSPVIDIDSFKSNNQTKAFRNIPNHFIIDEIRDISSQASEDHVSATKTISDSSFESTGPEVGNDLYDNGMATELRLSSNMPSNHKHNFADLRGVKDEDVDKYRTESNLQHIDSPLLYLKPSAPHKSFGNFVLAVSTPINDNEYEMYDDIPTTAAPPTMPSAWDESRNDYSVGLKPPPNYQPKIVQIIVPYTTSKKEEQASGDQTQGQQYWSETSDETYIGRKVPSNSESPYSTVTENYIYSTLATTTSDPNPTENSYDSDSEQLNSAAILNDLYDVKEPPFDIVKLQHTIDDWTEKEYSKYKSAEKPRSGDKHAKKIPDEYFTTTQASNYVTETNNYYDFYDHEGSSSNHHTVIEGTTYKPRKEYNNIERTKSRFSSAKNEDGEDVDKLHIYTAASSFRTSTTSTTSTTTPAPWGKIQTSISPLTKEKVYVVTSKPWRDAPNVTKDWYEVGSFESKKTKVDAETAGNVFMSPRFMNRPSFGFTSGGKVESVKSDSSYGFSRSWYQSINELEIKNNSTSIPGESIQRLSTNSEEGTTVSNRHKYK